jgi:hypothetical protein
MLSKTTKIRRFNMHLYKDNVRPRALTLLWLYNLKASVHILQPRMGAKRVSQLLDAWKKQFAAYEAERPF